MGAKITKLRVTNDKISGRGGLPLFLRYIENIGLYGLISSTIFLLVTKSSKGLQLQSFLKQMFAFFIDGTDMSISGFDHKKKDEGYAGLLENTVEEMASSHQIKRFFSKMSIITDFLFNKILHELFVWRLKISKPAIIKLGVDTMIMDNDYAKKREGNEFTYKKKNGLQALHTCWGSFLVDVLFRKGSAHSNHGTDYPDRVRVIVQLIRKRYSLEVPILVCTDSAFADKTVYKIFEQELGIHFITTSRIYDCEKEYIQELPEDNFQDFSKGKAIWHFAEFANMQYRSLKFRRCIYTTPHRDSDGQYIMRLVRKDNMIYTNIGICSEADQKLRHAGGERYFEAENIIRESHNRGADELIHRSIKELATKENLPFKRFGMNRAYYFLLVITHFIFEAYKQDITNETIPITVYPNTFRRKFIDFAAKITSRSGYTILNVSKTVYKSLNIAELWIRCQSPPKLECARI